MNKIFLIGAGGHGAVIKEILDDNSINISCFIDADFSVSECLGIRVIHEESEIVDCEDVAFVISVGLNQIRKKIANQKPRAYINAIHPSSIVSKSVDVGFGNAFMAGVCINARTKISNHCIVNTNATVPETFTRYVLRPESPLTIEFDVIAKNRTAWLDEWSTIVFK